jgi:hypothetical protein
MPRTGWTRQLYRTGPIRRRLTSLSTISATMGAPIGKPTSGEVKLGESFEQRRRPKTGLLSRKGPLRCQDRLSSSVSLANWMLELQPVFRVVLERRTSQGIILDEESQEQPKEKDRAQKVRKSEPGHMPQKR